MPRRRPITTAPPGLEQTGGNTFRGSVDDPIQIDSTPVSPIRARIPIRWLSHGSRLPNLSLAEQTLLRRKQAKLTRTAQSAHALLLPSSPEYSTLIATLIFAQHEAGTAVSISSDGLMLTCSHCIADTEGEALDDINRKWLLTYTGIAIQAKCLTWDSQRDLALLEIVCIEASPNNSHASCTTGFPFISIASYDLAVRDPIVCVGQPGAEDLEAPNGVTKATKYDLFTISQGRYRGMVKGTDPQDNSEIGSLMHDAWTYWGHSGAPLAGSKDGKLIGLHSSWDDQTCMRHGIPRIAIKAFLERAAAEHGIDLDT